MLYKINDCNILKAFPNFLKVKEVFIGPRFSHVYRFIDIMGLNFFIDKFTIKATF